jgi:hypothetical protein
MASAIKLDATGSSRGDSRSALNSSKREIPRDKPVASGDFGLILLTANVKFHGTRPWHLCVKPDRAAKNRRIYWRDCGIRTFLGATDR